MMLFLIGNIALGAGLAMDAFTVSIANALGRPTMRRRERFGIAGTFAFFQFLMPLVGFVIVTYAARRFALLDRYIPWIAFVLLAVIGIRMIREGLAQKDGVKEATSPGVGTLLVQGIATSIDALSAGLAFARYNVGEALAAALIIAAVTFAICMAGLYIGKRFGMVLADRATIIGGGLLIAIGIRILIGG